MTSLISAVCNAVSGLTAQSSCMANISDNLANSSTTGYKTIGTNFADLVSNGAALASGAGTSATPAYYNNLQGSVATVSSETYMAISGRGFFNVTTEDGNGTPDTTQAYYTRSGDFSLNRNGYLENSAGYCLMGWNVDPETGATSTGTLVPVQVSQLVDQGYATGALDYEANLPASLDSGKSAGSSKVNINDADSQEHTITYSWEKLDTNTWQLTINAPEGAYDATATPPNQDYTATATFTFADGKVTNIASTDCAVTNTATSHALSFDLSYLYTDPTTGATHIDTQSISSDFTKVTQFADEDNALSLYAFTQDGIPEGSFNKITIDDKGYLSLNYTNGVTKTYYQVPIATFNAPEQLQRVSGTAYTITEYSGTPTINASGTNGAGELTPSAIEQSTVDVADQFTRMVQAQQAYSANAKTITTADSMMQTLITI